MSESIVIERRFCGPPESAHGGYTCGRVAGLVRGGPEGPVEVTLRRPPPLDRAMAVGLEGDAVRLLHDGAAVAEGRPAELEVGGVPEVSLDEAREAAKGSAILAAPEEHPFPTCFTCGPERAPGDGLRIFPGPLARREGIGAATWTPDPGLAGADAAVDPVFVYAALDCTGLLGAQAHERSPAPGSPKVLGRQTTRLLAPVPAARPLVALGWLLGREGRKTRVASALLDARGHALALAEAVWIEPRRG